MKQNINIRGTDDRPKVGNYSEIRKQISKSAIKQIEKKSINSSTDSGKIATTKSIQDQIDESR